MPVLNSRAGSGQGADREERFSRPGHDFSREMLLADRGALRAIDPAGGEDAQSAADGLRATRSSTAWCSRPDQRQPGLNIRAMDNASAKEILSEINKRWVELADPVKKLLDAASGLRDVKRPQAGIDRLADDAGKLSRSTAHHRTGPDPHLAESMVRRGRCRPAIIWSCGWDSRRSAASASATRSPPN
jgi:hypothetical protein